RVSSPVPADLDDPPAGPRDSLEEEGLVSVAELHDHGRAPPVDRGLGEALVAGDGDALIELLAPAEHGLDLGLGPRLLVGLPQRVELGPQRLLFARAPGLPAVEGQALEVDEREEQLAVALAADHVER